MWHWFERWQQRQVDLAHGVDADLIAENRRRYKLGFVLLGVGSLLALVSQRFLWPNGSRRIIYALAVVSFVAGFVLIKWAGQQSAFLNQPDPEDPPKLWKN